MKIKNSKKVYVFTVLVFILVGFLHSETQPQQPSNYSDPDAGLEANPYLISNLANLRWLSEVSDDWWKGENIQVHFLQTTDINASETINWNGGSGFKPIAHVMSQSPWEPEVIFFGVYDGGNYVIENLFCANYTIPYGNIYTVIGFFAKLNSSTIKNFHLINMHISGINTFTMYNILGGIAADAINSTIENSSVSGLFNSNVSFAIAGGLIGKFDASIIQNSSSSVDIDLNTPLGTASSNIGGLVGESFDGATIINSYSTGNIVVNNFAVGGIVGRMNRTSIQNCYSIGHLFVSDEGAIVGGIAGRHESSSYYPNSSIIGSFWDIETVLVSEALGFNHNDMCDIENTYGLPTSEMKQATTYINNGWDFDNVWGIHPDFNVGYPFLRGMPGTPEEIFPPPIDFAAIVEGNSVILSWEAPDGNPLGYNLYRNDDLLTPDLLVDTTFTDLEVPIGIHVYSLQAIYQTGESDAVTVEVEIIPEIFLPPSNFEGSVESNTVTLNWTAPESNPMGYKLYRDEFPLYRSLLLGTTFTDYDVPDGTHIYSLQAIYQTGESEIVFTEIEVRVSERDEIEIPVFTELLGNFPNPFNPDTTIRYNVAQAGNVVIDIYNVRGQKIATLLNSHKEAGEHTAVWQGLDGSGREVSSGIYLAIMRMDDFTQIRRMTLLK